MDNHSPQIGLFNSVLSKSLIKPLEEEGNKIITFPQVSTEELDLNENEQRIVNNLQSFDWLIFTDIHSVEYFLAKLDNFGIDLFEIDNLRVCAFGEAVADRLRFVQLHSDIISSNFNDEDIFELIKSYIFDLEEFIDLEVLLIKDSKKEFLLTKYLNETKANVIELNVYNTQKIENTYKLKALLKGGGIDEIILFMPEEVFALSEILGSKQFSDFFSETELFSNDEITFQTLLEFGIKSKLLQQKRG